jgi:hypothetical protein
MAQCTKMNDYACFIKAAKSMLRTMLAMLSRLWPDVPLMSGSIVRACFLLV